MARFRGTIQGCRGPASRLGGKDSGLSVDGGGWHIGGSIWCHDDDGADMVSICATGGSGGGSNVLLGIVTYQNGNRRVEIPESIIKAVKAGKTSIEF